MNYSNLLVDLLQLILGVSMFVVWFFRYRSPGFSRGGDSTTMEEEFRVYGLSDGFRNLIRVLKICAGTLMIVGIWHDAVALIAGAGLAVLMAGAMVMHLKVKDPLYKLFPASVFFVMCLAVAWAHLGAL